MYYIIYLYICTRFVICILFCALCISYIYIHTVSFLLLSELALLRLLLVGPWYVIIVIVIVIVGSKGGTPGLGVLLLSLLSLLSLLFWLSVFLTVSLLLLLLPWWLYYILFAIRIVDIHIINVHIYIYMYIYIHVYIYIYVLMNPPEFICCCPPGVVRSSAAPCWETRISESTLGICTLQCTRSSGAYRAAGIIKASCHRLDVWSILIELYEQRKQFFSLVPWKPGWFLGIPLFHDNPQYIG